MAVMELFPVWLLERLVSLHGTVGKEEKCWYRTARENPEKLAGVGAYWNFRKSLAKRLYRLTDAEVDLWYIAVKNVDTETGYSAYYALEKSVLRRSGDEAVLYDLSASFAWDERFEKELYDLLAADPNPVL